MKRNGRISLGLAPAALPLALALALLGLAAPAVAQDALPSVNDYRLPSPGSSPRARPQGPVDLDNPVVITPAARPAEPSAAPAPAPTASASPRARPSAAAAAPAAATPAAAVSTRPANTAPASPRPAQAAQPASPASPATTAATSAQAQTPAPSSATPASPEPSASAPPFEWNVHSASDVAGQATGSWPWLAGLAFLLGAGVMLLVQVAMRRRKAREVAIDWETPAEAAPAPVQVKPAPVQPAVKEPQPLAEPDAPVLDLLTIMAKPESAPAPDSAAPAPAVPQPRPALGLVVNPLDVVLSARRLSATLMNAVLNYELTVSNNGREPIGPIIVGGDMIGAHASLPDRAQLELGGQTLVPLHRHPAIAPGESVTLSGEFKLPLAAITPIRSGNAALFIPLARFRVEASRNGGPPLVVARTFVVGENQDRPGAALKPFRLDLGPRLYSHIGQRELALSA